MVAINGAEVQVKFACLDCAEVFDSVMEAVVHVDATGHKVAQALVKVP